MDNEDVESLYSSEAEEGYENNVQEVEVTHDDEDVCKNVTSLGMTFEAYDETYDYYNTYSRIVGFSMRKQRLDKDKRSALITRREFCCNRESFYTKKML